MKTTLLPRSPVAQLRAFSLVEMLGVLTVITIMAMAVMPTLLRRIDKAAKDTESAALQQLGAGLKEYILDSRTVPSAATVHSNIANELGLQTSQVASNSRGNPRFYLVDPHFRLGSNHIGNLPYVQGIYGCTNNNDDLRVLLITSMGEALPSIITNWGASSNTVFDGIWNAPDFTMPAGWSWGGNWADIMVQRLSLEPLFVQVALNNNSAQMGRISIDTTNTTVALPSTNFSPYYLSRTVLGLHSDTGVLQVKQVLQDVSSPTNTPSTCLAPSFVYDQGIWRGRLFATQAAPGSTQAHTPLDLQAAYNLFMSGPANVYGTSGKISQTNVTVTMYRFMSNYVYWASNSFPAGGKATVTTAQSAMSSEVGNYCNKKASTL